MCKAQDYAPGSPKALLRVEPALHPLANGRIHVEFVGSLSAPRTRTHADLQGVGRFPLLVKLQILDRCYMSAVYGRC